MGVYMKSSIKVKGLDYLSNYMKVTSELLFKLEKHCKKYNISNPEICAYYKDREDFYSDWCSIGYTRDEARKLLQNNTGEFQKFATGEIVRYVM